MDCKQVEELIDAHALGALDPAEKAEVETHLSECGDCRVQYEQSRIVAEQLALSVQLHSAPEGLFHRTMADIYRDLAEEQRSAQPIRWYTPQRLLERVTPIGAAAAAVLAVVALGLGMRLDDRVDRLDSDENPQMVQGGAPIQEQQLANLAFASEDLLSRSLGDAAGDPTVDQPGDQPAERPDQQPSAPEGEGSVGAIYAWSQQWGVGVLLVTGLAIGHQYLACFELEEGGASPGGVLIGQGNFVSQKAFKIITSTPVVAVGLTTNATCDEGGDPSDTWLHYWSLTD